MSKIYYCHKECYHGNVLWDIGDEYEADDGEELPHHFKDVPVGVEKKFKRPMTADAREVPVTEASTLHDIAVGQTAALVNKVKGKRPVSMKANA